MNERTHYRLSLTLPFVAGSLWDAMTNPSEPDGRGIREFILWMALAPYAVFALGLTLWSMREVHSPHPECGPQVKDQRWRFPLWRSHTWRDRDVLHAAASATESSQALAWGTT